jgi:hypothetical protein
MNIRGRGSNKYEAERLFAGIRHIVGCKYRKVNQKIKKEAIFLG